MSDILSETFVIYARHFWKFVVLVAVVQVPATLLVLILMRLDNAAISIAVNFANVIALMLVYGATICAVGQHYVTNNVSVGVCYARVMWRMISMMFLAMIMAVLLISLLLLAEIRTIAVIPLVLLSAAALCVYMIYLTTVAPAVMVEGYKSVTALKRGFRLARSSEGRILGHLLVYSLVAVGLLVVLLLPFLLFANPVTGEQTSSAPATPAVSQSDVTLASGQESSTVSTQTTPAASEQTSTPNSISPPLVLGSMVVGILVPPVTYIATTLLYYDLRVRKEGYDMSRLSAEMGVSPV